jgi:hypothetical protein
MYCIVLPICTVVYSVLYSIYVLTGVISYVLHCVCTSLFSVCVSQHYMYFVSVFCMAMCILSYIGYSGVFAMCAA